MSSGSLFSILLWKIMDIVCCMAMVFIFFEVFIIIAISGILSLSSNIFIEGMYVVTLALVVMTIIVLYNVMNAKPK